MCVGMLTCAYMCGGHRLTNIYVRLCTIYLLCACSMDAYVYSLDLFCDLGFLFLITIYTYM